MQNEKARIASPINTEQKHSKESADVAAKLTLSLNN